jgi:hypothetical protein
LLVLSANSLSSDWIEHEIRAVGGVEREVGREVLHFVALDDHWKAGRAPNRILEQFTEYNIVDFSAWRDDSQFDGIFHKLIEGLELF